MIDEIKNLVSKRDEYKFELDALLNQVKATENEVLRILVENQAYDMFSINWPRLRRMLDRMVGHRN